MLASSLPLPEDFPISGPCRLPDTPVPREESVWETSHAVSVWTRLTVAFLALIALVCLHYVFYSLRVILVPFFVSGFLVFALQPSVEFAYCALAGRLWPHRWLVCCCKRRLKRLKPTEEEYYGTCCIGWGRSPESPGGSESRASEQEVREAEPLLAEVPTFAVMLAEVLCRVLAVALAVGFMLLIASVFLVLLCHGAMHMKDHWDAYRTGLARLQRIQDSVIESAAKGLDMEATVDQHMKQAYDQMLDEAQGLVWMVMNALLSGLSEGVSWLLIVLMYVLFWLMQPLPTTGKVSAVVRSYLLKKSFVSALYGGFVTLLFKALSIDLAIFFGVVSFFLNFVPEVGALISMVVPVPVIVLDGRQENPLLVLLAATAGQVVLKFVIGNILEVKLIERDREMNIHPVWIILGLSYFGYVWGPLGALISVPMLAMVKTAALSVRGTVLKTEAVVPAIAEAVLACLEGRNTCWAKARKDDDGRSPLPTSRSQHPTARAGPVRPPTPPRGGQTPTSPTSAPGSPDQTPTAPALMTMA